MKHKYPIHYICKINLFCVVDHETFFCSRSLIISTRRYRSQMSREMTPIPDILTVNIGGTHHKAGRKQREVLARVRAFNRTKTQGVRCKLESRPATEPCWPQIRMFIYRYLHQRRLRMVLDAKIVIYSSGKKLRLLMEFYTHIK